MDSHQRNVRRLVDIVLLRKHTEDTEISNTKKYLLGWKKKFSKETNYMEGCRFVLR